MMNGGASRKVLPPRPTHDLGYGSANTGGVGGAQNRSRGKVDNYAPQNGRVAMSSQEPGGKTILEGYRQDIMTGFEEKPRYNPVSIPTSAEARGKDLMVAQ
jgi:hypothetical protein